MSSDITQPDERGRSRWRWMAAWSVCCVSVLVAVFALGTCVRSPWQDAIENSTTVPVVTAPVERRSLAMDPTSALGKVSLGSTTSVTMTSDASVSVVTATRKAPGEVLRPGEALADVSGRPLIALALPFRLYRDLVPDTDAAPAPDVSAVQQALSDLGLYEGPVDGVYGPSTAEAVTRLYTRAVLTPPAPAAEAISAVEQAEDAVADAQASVSAGEAELAAATAALDQARRDRETATSPEGIAQADASVAAALAQVTSATTSCDAARRTRDEARNAAAQSRLAASTPLPMAEVLRVPVTGVDVVGIAAVGTELSGDGASVAQLRSGEPAVTVRVGASEADAFTPGAEVTVAATADTSLSSLGTVDAVGSFVSTPTEAGAPPGYDVTVHLPADQTFSEGQDVRVIPTTSAPDLEGLAVPLVAVREDSDGSYVLVPATDDGHASRRTAVSVVGSADGYAIVTGDGLEEGALVVVSDGT